MNPTLVLRCFPVLFQVLSTHMCCACAAFNDAFVVKEQMRCASDNKRLQGTTLVVTHMRRQVVFLCTHVLPFCSVILFMVTHEG